MLLCDWFRVKLGVPVPCSKVGLDRDKGVREFGLFQNVRLGESHRLADAARVVARPGGHDGPIWSASRRRRVRYMSEQSIVSGFHRASLVCQLPDRAALFLGYYLLGEDRSKPPLVGRLPDCCFIVAFGLS